MTSSFNDKKGSNIVGTRSVLPVGPHYNTWKRNLVSNGPFWIRIKPVRLLLSENARALGKRLSLVISAGDVMSVFSTGPVFTVHSNIIGLRF